MPEECDSDPSITRDSQRMTCFYQAALTVAYLCGAYDASRAGSAHCEQAVTICSNIWNRFGASSGATNDQKRKAELVTNTCYNDVAKITRDSYVCGYIGTSSSGAFSGSVSHQLVGDQVTREACMDETTRLADLAPDRYYDTGKNNICSLVFVLPLFVFGVLSFRIRD